MSTRERPVDRGARLAGQDLIRIGGELRAARIGAGLSLRFVAGKVGISATQVMRFERGLVLNASVRQLARIGAVVGLTVRVRAYPGGDPVRDAAQAKLLARLAGRLHAGLRFRTEVPLPIQGDQRAWDGWISQFVGAQGGRGLPVDAETRLHDIRALLRRLTLKLRDSGAASVLLVVADTRSNREAVAAAEQVLAGLFPVSTRRALASLATGHHPGGSALIFL
jgi:transcriptional regulator with XRE-family HTH domain